MEPIRSNLNSSVSDELERAEEAHLAGCPEADFTIRLAALILDCILIYVGVSGLKNLSQALGVFLNHSPTSAWATYLDPNLTVWLSDHSNQIAAIFEITSKIVFVFIYAIVTTATSGGTPGKLLLGLRVLDSETGKKLSSFKALNRYLLAIATNVPSLGLIYISSQFRRDKRALHDQILRTSVKKVHGVR